MLALGPLSAHAISGTGVLSGEAVLVIDDLATANCSRVRRRWGTGWKYGTGIRWGEGQRENPGRPCDTMGHYLRECDPPFMALVVPVPVPEVVTEEAPASGGTLLGFGPIGSASISALPVTTTTVSLPPEPAAIFTEETAPDTVFTLEPVCG